MMDEDSNNIDPFSSLMISSNHNQDDNFLHNKDKITRKKLKVVRKRKDVIIDGSSINSLRYKLKVKYGGQFRPINNGKKEKYCYGKQKTLYFEEITSSFVELLEDVSRLYHEDERLKLCFLDNRVATQSFIQLEDEESYRLMLKMYEEKKEVVIYATLDKMIQGDRVGEDGGLDTGMCIGEQENYEEWSDYCPSEDSYHSLHSDSEYESDEANETVYEGELYLYDKDDPKMEVGAKYPHVVAFRRALNHYAIINDFEYESTKTEPARVTANCANPQCSWRIHATVAEDGVTFVVRTLQQKHTCYGINKRGNKHATQGWVEERVINDLRKEGDISVKVLKQRLESKFGISVSYQRVWQGKELALGQIYGNWKDSFVQVGALREELRERNPESVVELKVEPLNGGSRHFQRFFVALEACITRFLIGCSWISEERHKPIINLIDSIRQKIMVRFNERRRIVRSLKGLIVPKVIDYIQLISQGLNGYTVHKSLDFTAYAHGIAPMPSKDKWVKHDLGYKMFPPILKRPVGRQKKMDRIKASDEPRKRSHKCTRCGLYGHYRSTCKNAVPSQENENGSTAPRTQGSRQKRGANIDTAQQRKRACSPTIFKILEEENI